VNEYDDLVSIYDLWSAADPASLLTLEFYTKICCEEAGEIVELGTGPGRIALEVAQRGKSIIGVDISEKMLAECKSRAIAFGVDHLIELKRADFRTFTLNLPANLIILPFRTLGHLLSLEDKFLGFKQIYLQLAPGGRFVFDHYIINRDWAKNHHGIPKLMNKSFNENTGGYQLIWDTYLYDFERQLMDCTITVEKTGHDSIVTSRQHFPLKFSWIDPIQTMDLLNKVGFQIDGVFGNFDLDQIDGKSSDQVWFARRPNLK
jgi:SAM-dependent methyltransferase